MTATYLFRKPRTGRYPDIKNTLFWLQIRSASGFFLSSASRPTWRVSMATVVATAGRLISQRVPLPSLAANREGHREIKS